MSGKLTANILAAGIDRIRMDDTGYYALLEFPTDDDGVKIVALPSEVLGVLAALALSVAPKPSPESKVVQAHRLTGFGVTGEEEGPVILRLDFAKDAEIRFQMSGPEAHSLSQALRQRREQPEGDRP